jgi:dihydroneopterin aldolase/2-amino-4-hydroxy-6-hydroxymethyldihydropteridine diphosphokinase
MGSNINPEENILKALNLLSKCVKIRDVSTVYLTEPLKQKNQPSYFNCIVKIETDILPTKLKLDVLRMIEAQLGRERTRDKYASRTIDLDLIIYDNIQMNTEQLVLPDPEIQERAFLAVPLFEVEPELLLPGSNKPLKEVVDKFRSHKMIAQKEFSNEVKKLVKSSSVQNL